MEKGEVQRHWKEVHRRKGSTSSLNGSFTSRSSLSSGYNKFHFHKAEDQGKRNSIFHFTARNRDNPHDVSVLTKKEKLMTPRIPKVGSES